MISLALSYAPPGCIHVVIPRPLEHLFLHVFASGRHAFRVLLVRLQPAGHIFLLLVSHDRELAGERLVESFLRQRVDGRDG